MSLEKETNERNTWIQDLYQDVKFFKRNLGSTQKVYQSLKRLGYEVEYFLVNNGKKYIRNEFLKVCFFGEQCIIDIKFKEKFIIARPTHQYYYVLENIPEVFVGREKELINVVSYIASEIHLSFKVNDLELPPWRQKKTILLNWLLH